MRIVQFNCRIIMTFDLLHCRTSNSQDATAIIFIFFVRFVNELEKTYGVGYMESAERTG